MTTLSGEPALSAPAVGIGFALPEAVEAMRRRLLRLAFDVHDGPMQSLVAVGWGLQQLREDITRGMGAGDTNLVATQLDLLGAELFGVEAGLRGLITMLERDGSAEIPTLEAIAAIEIAAFRRRCGAATEVLVQADVRPDSHSQELAITAVLREALNNIAKHAHADEVRVCLRADDAEILLEINDNGDGFNPATTGPGIGLTGMGERVRLLEGDLKITSASGGPTRVSARFRRWAPATAHRPAA
jgi:signal transduction histidine kinase